MKKLLKASFIILVLLAFLGSCTDVSNGEPSPVSKRYSITELVPGEVIIVNYIGKGWGEFTNPAQPLSEGVHEVGKNYIIKSATSINESVAGGYAGGSRTSALLLIVEPRKK
ncbi:MAG: hypothetical protein Q8N59_00425 [bacterium]|nr:hypothetical protein [bacterium]